MIHIPPTQGGTPLSKSIVATRGIMCRICFDICTHKTTCRCGNIAMIIDSDDMINIYVEEIKTTQRVILYHIGDFVEIRRELLQPFSSAIYADYDFYDEPYTARPYAKKRKEPRLTATEYDTSLIQALTRYNYNTSDGKEKFKRTTTKETK